MSIRISVEDYVDVRVSVDLVAELLRLKPDVWHRLIKELGDQNASRGAELAGTRAPVAITVEQEGFNDYQALAEIRSVISQNLGRLSHHGLELARALGA